MSHPELAPLEFYGVQVWPRGIRVHPESACTGERCCFHNPSDHPMRSWPMVVRETALVERMCAHGVGHPDPDSLAFFVRKLGDDNGGTFGIHGCDGCGHHGDTNS